MQKLLAFEIPGPPIPKLRARVVYNRAAGRAMAFTPQSTQDGEALVRGYGHDAAQGDTWPVGGPLTLLVVAVVPIPRSWAKRKRAEAIAGVIRPDIRPDWDNFGKLVSDALNGVVYHDDSQIVTGTCEKYYGERPRTMVAVYRAMAAVPPETL